MAATSTSRPSRLAVNSAHAATRNIKELIGNARARIAAVSALNNLNMKNYRQVAEKCLKVLITESYFYSFLVF